MESSYPHSEHTVSDLLEFIEDPDLKFVPITTHEFLSLGCAGTFKYLGYYPQKKYTCFAGRENTDYFVRQALKLYDFPYFQSLYGYSRKPKLGNAYTKLLNFARPVHTKEMGFKYPWSEDEQNDLLGCYEQAKKFPQVVIFSAINLIKVLNPCRPSRKQQIACPLTQQLVFHSLAKPKVKSNPSLFVRHQ